MTLDTTDESFSFIGTLHGTDTVFIIIRDEGGAFQGMLSDPLATDEFDTIPRPVSDFFNRNGIYTATAFTDGEIELDGFTIKIEFDGEEIWIK